MFWTLGYKMKYGHSWVVTVIYPMYRIEVGNLDTQFGPPSFTESLDFKSRFCYTIPDQSRFADRSEPPMEDLKSAMGEHMDQMADLVEKLTAELRSGLRPAYDNFLGFFHAIDWTVSLSLSLSPHVCVCAFKYICNLLICLYHELRRVWFGSKISTKLGPYIFCLCEFGFSWELDGRSA